MKMKNNSIYTYIVWLVALAFGLVVSQSCTETEYEQLLRPYNAIERFRIAGYGDIDSIKAVISGDSIVLYWPEDYEAPSTVTPTIAVSAGAIISPASGEAVAFSENTVYTVTAEDGTTRQYRLIPQFNQPIPVVIGTSPVSYAWLATNNLTITGQYFLATGDKSDIRVYAQRLRDGFEFDLLVDTANSSQTSLSVSLPPFTTALDTGRHRIYVQVGNFDSNYADIWLRQPLQASLTITAALAQTGQPIHPGDMLTVNYSISDNYDGAITRYFAPENFTNISLRVHPLPYNATSYRALNNISISSITDTQFKFVLPEGASSYYGYCMGQIHLLGTYPYSFEGTNALQLTFITDDATTIVTEKE